MDRPSSHSQKVPYSRKEGRKSLFSKMKDSMRDMLSPSWLSDLVHNVKKDSPGAVDRSIPMGSDQMAGMQPGSPGLGDMDTPQQALGLPQGPVAMTISDAQRAELNRDPSFKSRGSFLGNGQPRTLDFAGLRQGVNPNETMSSPFQQGSFPPPLSEFTSAQLPLARLTEKSDSIMAQDTLSQRSDGSKSTSGCSSMIPQADVPRQETVGDKRKAPEHGAVGGPSPREQQAAKRQRVLGTPDNQIFSRRLSDTFYNKSAIGHRPAFNTTLFGSPLTNESSLLGTSFHESSFYPGKTKFGGRSSLSFRSQKKTVDLNQSLPGRLSVPVKAFMKAKPRLNPNKEAVTSSTAKRILEALDKMPTPLNDAKKIPMVPRQWTESPSFFARDRSLPRSGPPTQKLNVSSQMSISKNRQVSFAPVGQPKPSTSQAPDETVRKPTRQDTVMLNTETVGSGKMRREKSYHKGSASVKTTLEEQDTVIIPDLNTDFTLPVSSMPKFSFMAPISQPKSVEPVSKQKSEEPVAQPKWKEPVTNSALSQSPVKQSLKFTFSSPIIEPVPSNKPESPQKFGAFQFSSPISVDKKKEVKIGHGEFSKQIIPTTLNTTASTPAFSFSSPANKLNMDYSFSTAPKPKPKINGPTEPSDGGYSVASELKQGSVMDILGGGSFKMSSAPSSQSSTPLTGVGGTEISQAPPLSTLFKQSGWSCDICLINNKDEVDKCVACQTPKPGGQKPKEMPDTKTRTSEPPNSDLFTKFQPPSGSWTCDMCLIQNKSDFSKCVACQSQKPGASSFGSSSLTSTIQPGNWICSKCLIQNKQAVTVCGACKTAKSTSKTSEINKSDSLFAKLRPAAGSWECEMCLVQNKGDANSCVACQTLKPLKFFKHPPGDWTCDTCLVSNKETAVNCVACNYARPGPPRTQAVPSIAKSYTSSQAAGFSIPATSDSSSISQSSTAGFKFTAPAEAGSVTSGFDVGKINEDTKKASDTKPVIGGFKFNADSSSLTSASSGFKFGVAASSDSDKSSVSTGGFKMNTVVSLTDKQAEKTDVPLKSAGFQFGNSDSSLSSVSSSASNVATTGGFTLSQKTDGSAMKDQLQATTSVPGGFTFKPSESLSSAKSTETETTKTVTNSSQSIGGFNFTTVTSSSSSLAAPSNNSIGAFTFTATKVTEPSILSGTAKPSEGPASTVGGLTFGQQSAESNTSNQPFSFAQKTAPVASPTKRGRDEDTGEPIAKKTPFSFGQTTASNSSSPFQFGASTVTATSSGSSSLFAFGQKPTTSASTGQFAFGQQNSTPVTSTGLSVFGTQNSVPASKTIPSVFGQPNAPVTTTSSTFAFNGQKTTQSSASTLPVFGQTNSLTTTTTASAPSLFQFGQTNNTASAALGFNFATQSSGQSSVFGSSTPSFNFTAQKTETSTAASAPGLFKFGASQPAPATTPAFGSASAFGSSSTPAFGTGCGTTGAFSGNAPSTMPAFGATPPAFGSSNSNTVQAAPAFGENVGSLTNTSSDQFNICDESLSKTSQSESSSCTTVNNLSEESFFHGCYEDLEDGEETENEHDDCTDKLNTEEYGNNLKVTAEQSMATKGACVDVVCQTEVFKLGQKSAVTQTDQINGLDWKVVYPHCSSKHVKSEEVQTELPVSMKINVLAMNTPKAQIVPSVVAGLQVERTNIKHFSTEHTGQESCTVSLKSLYKPLIVVPNTGAANEPLSCGKLFVVPCSKDYLSTAIRLSPAITQPLMTSKLTQVTDMSLGFGTACNGQSLTTASVPSVFRFGANHCTTFSSTCTVGSSICRNVNLAVPTPSKLPVGNTSLQSSFSVNTFLNLPSSTVNSLQFRIGSSQAVSTKSQELDKNSAVSAVAEPVFDNINKPVTTGVSPVFGIFNKPATTGMSPVIGYANKPVTTEVLPVLGYTNKPASPGMSPVFGNINKRTTTGISPVFGYTNKPASTGISPVFGNISKPTITQVSPVFGYTNKLAVTGMSPVFGNINKPTITGISPLFGNFNNPVTKGVSPVLGNTNKPASTGVSPVFGNINKPTTTEVSQVFGYTNKPAITGMSPVFGNINKPTITGISPLFGNFNKPVTTGVSPVLGNTNKPASTGMSPVFGNINTPTTTGVSPVYDYANKPTITRLSPLFGTTNKQAITGVSPAFGIFNRPATTGMSTVFGNANKPATMGISPDLGNTNKPASTGMSPVFGNINKPTTSGVSPVLGNFNKPTTTGMSPVFGYFNKPITTGISQIFGNGALSEGSKLTMNNKTGFVLRIPFKADTQQGKPHNKTCGANVSHNVSSSSGSKCMFGTLKETPKKFDFHSASNSIYIDQAGTSSVKSFTCRSGRNIDMQSGSTDYSCKPGPSRKSGCAGVFSFQGPAIVDDVIMEECSPVSTISNQGTPEESVVQAGPSKRVAFSFSPPQVADDQMLHQKYSSPIYKGNKSILKSKTREMVTAFDAATVCAGNKKQNQSDYNNRTKSVFKVPSVSSVFGGTKTFGDAEAVKVCNSKSMPLRSEVMVKVHQEGSMDTSSGSTEHEQNVVNFGSKGSKSIPNFHSWGSTSIEHKTLLPVRFKDKKEPTPSTKSVSYSTVTSADSFSTGLFTFSAKPASSSVTGKISPPSFKHHCLFALSSNTTSQMLNSRNSETSAGTCSSPALRNVFVFSANGSSLSKSNSSSSFSGSKVKNSRSKSPNKHLTVSAFSGKFQDENMYPPGEPSVSSSRFSKSTDSSKSGSDISGSSSSSSSSSDDGHSLASSSSSTSSTSSAGCIDHADQSGSLPMEDDLCKGNSSGEAWKDDVHMDTTSKENKSWNACPEEEKYFYARAKTFCFLIQENWLNVNCYLEYADRLPRNVSCSMILFTLDEINNRLEVDVNLGVLLPYLSPGVFGNPSQQSAPAQSVFQFGAKPADSSQSAPSVGFNFNANPAGLGAGNNFNFSAQTPAVNAFSAGPGTPAEGRKIKKAARRIKR